MESKRLLHELRHLSQAIIQRLRCRGLWPAASVLRHSGLFRQTIHCTADAMFHVAHRPGAALPFRAQGADPQCRWNPTDGHYPRGWVELTLYAKSHETWPLQPVLYFDRGGGFCEMDSVSLPAPAPYSGLIRHIFYLPRGVVALRFDPGVEGDGDFDLCDVQMRELSPTEALWKLGLGRQLTRSTSMHARLRLAQNMLGAWRVGGAQQLFAHVTANAQRDKETYAGWVEHYDTLSDLDRHAIAMHSAALPNAPEFIVLMPTAQVPAAVLRAAIAAVRTQLFARWRLCLITEDAGPLLQRIAADEPRISTVTAQQTLPDGWGDHVVWVPAHGVLRPHALYMMACELQSAPDARIIYTDEDTLDAHGKRCQPIFRSGWNLELARCTNLFGSICLFDRHAFTALPTYADAGDIYALALRASEQAAAHQIRHIPHILFHRRSDAPQADAAHNRDRCSVRDHLKRQRVAADVADGATAGLRRIRYHVPTPVPRVSIIIPTRDGLHLLKRCLESIVKRTSYSAYNIIVVDNQTQDLATLRFLATLPQRYPARTLAYNAPFNFSAINNVAAQASDADVLVLLNNDTEVISPGWLDELVGFAMQPGTGAVGAMLYYSNDTIQHAGVVMGPGGVAGHVHKHLPRGSLGYTGRAAVAQNLSAVTGACLAVRRSVYLSVGGLDERLAVAFNDVDFCLRLQERGLQNVWTPFAELFHHESVTRGLDANPANVERFARELAIMRSRWGDRLHSDPYFGPNLAGESCALASPPTASKPWRGASSTLQGARLDHAR